MINTEGENRTQLLQNILDNSPNCIYVKDKQGRYIIANKTIADLYQTTPDGMIGKKDEDFADQAVLRSNEAEFFKDVDKKAIETKETQTIPCESFTYDDGTIHYFFTIKKPITYQGDPDCVMGISVDITKLKETQIQASKDQKRFERIFSMSSELICEADINTATFTKINPAFNRVLGYSEEELLSKSFLEFIHPDDKESTQNVIDEQLKRGEKVLSFINRYRCKDGSYVWLDWNSHPVPEEGFTYAVARDISEKKNAEEALKESEDMFRSFLDSIPEMVYSIDWNKNVLYVNDASAASLRKPKEEIIGMSLFELFPKEIAEEYSKDIQEVFKSRKNLNRKIRTEIGGRKFALIISLTPIMKNDSVESVLGIARDITKQITAEERLKESEKKYRTYIDHAPNGVFVSDEQGRYLEVNDKAAETTGYSEDELLQMNISDMLPEEGKEQGLHHFQTLLKEGKSSGEAPFIHKDGSIRWWQVNAVKLSENRFLALTQDVTDKKQYREALAENERKYRQLYEAQVNGFAIFKSVFNDKGEFVSYEFIDINPAYERITGVKRDEVIGKDIQEVFPGTEQSWIDAYGSVAVSGEPKTFEMYHEPTRKHYFCNVFRPWDDNQRFCVAFNDVTKSKKAERETEMILNTAADGIRIVTKDFKIKKTNDTFAEMVGLSKDELIDRYCYDLFKSSYCGTENCGVRRVLRTGRGFEEETTRTTLDNRGIPCILKVSPYRDENDEIIGVIEDYRDITSLKKSQERFRNIFENKGTATGTFGEDNVITQCNSKFVEQSGYTRDEILGKMRWFDFVHKDDLERMMKFHRQRSEGGNPPGVYECRMVQKNGEQRTMIINIGILEGSTERVVSLVDITKQKTVENQLRKTQEELKRLNENLEGEVEDRTEKIGRLLLQKDEMINQLGHDLKNPLGPIINLVPILIKKETDPKKLELLDAILRSSEYMKDLVIKSIQLAKLNASIIEFAFEDINLREISQEVLDSNFLLFKENNISFENLIQEDIVVNADRLQLQEVFNNLFNNAVKYTEGDGLITINAQDLGATVEVSIKDEGIGMNEEQIDKIFNEFYKADISRHDFESSGLGMSICKRIIEKHEGKIWAESEGIGKGSTIKFTLQKDHKIN